MVVEQPIRVVVADDHTLVRQGTSQLLQRQPDIEVVGEATDGEEALAMIESRQPDVALIDVTMPRLDGVETCRRIVSEHPNVAVIALTVHDEDEYATALLEAGASGYLLKDIDTDELSEAIRSVHGGAAAVDPRLVRGMLERMRTRGLATTAAPEASPREVQVLRLAALGMSNRDIATDLGISAWTVQSHLANVFEKLGASSRTHAVVRALQAGWIELDELE